VARNRLRTKMVSEDTAEFLCCSVDPLQARCVPVSEQGKNAARHPFGPGVSGKRKIVTPKPTA